MLRNGIESPLAIVQVLRCHEVVDAVHDGLGGSCRAAGEPQDQAVLAIVMEDVGIGVADALEQRPEVQHIRKPGRRRIHADDRQATFLQEGVMRAEQLRLDERDLRPDQVDLAGLGLQRVGRVRVAGAGFALVRREEAQQRQAVVVENGQPDVAPPQIEAGQHHVDDAVGERVVLAESIATVALDVDDAIGIADRSWRGPR